MENGPSNKIYVDNFNGNGDDYNRMMAEKSYDNVKEWEYEQRLKEIELMRGRDKIPVPKLGKEGKLIYHN